MKFSQPGNTVLVLSSLCFGAALALTAIYLFKGPAEVSAGDVYIHQQRLSLYEDKIEDLEKRLADLDSQQPRVVISAPTIPQSKAGSEDLEQELNRLRVENSRILQEQEEARQSLATTNRIISELEFRVETHSRSFRPLKVQPRDQGQDRLRRVDSGRLLPPIQDR